VLEALAEILLARIFRRRPSREARECYLAYTFRPAIRSRIDAARRERGRKRLLPHAASIMISKRFSTV